MRNFNFEQLNASIINVGVVPAVLALEDLTPSANVHNTTHMLFQGQFPPSSVYNYVASTSMSIILCTYEIICMQLPY